MWSNVLPVMITGALGFVGIVYTQRRADRREAGRWDREHAREMEVWAREDSNRSFVARCNAYEAVLVAWDRLNDGVPDPPADGTYNELDPPWEHQYQTFWDSTIRIDIYGSDDAIRTARTLLDETQNWLGNVREGKPGSLSEARNRFVQAIRRDIRVTRT